MARNAGQLVDSVKTAVMQLNADPMTKVTIRIGADGAEYDIEHIKCRTTLFGPELIIETEEAPRG